MQNVQFINRGSDPLAEALSSIIGQRQQQQQFDQQTTRSQQSQQDARDWQLKMAALQAYQTITDPATKAAAYTKLAPEIQAQIPDPSSLPTPEPTAEEQASVAASRADRDAMAKGSPDPIEGASMNAPADSRIASAGASLPVSRESSTGIGSDIGGGDTAPPVEAPTVSDRLNARIAQYRQGAKGAAPPKELMGTWVTDLTHGDAGLAAANDVERKVLPSAEDQMKAPLIQAQANEANQKAATESSVREKNIAEARWKAAQTSALMTTGAPQQGTGDPSVDPNIHKTAGGNLYADVTGYSVAKTRDALRKTYQGQGITVITDKDEAYALRDIDGARMNVKNIEAAIDNKLPKDAAGRLIGGPENRLAALFQTDEDLAAFNTWRSAAVKNLRATTGSKSLRITQAEVELAVRNDIPNITDTVGVAKQKMKIVNQMLDANEMPILKRDMSAVINPTSTSGATTGRIITDPAEALKLLNGGH